MNQRLIWNFEFSTIEIPSFSTKEPPDTVKWEIRYFWPADRIIHLYAIDKSLLDIRHYQQKYKEDLYCLFADDNYNIKYRKNELLYKPLLKHATKALGFGAKINLGTASHYPQEDSASVANLQKIRHQAHTLGTKILVKKVAFIYKFTTVPSIKLELARLEVNNAVYFSACIEGKSLPLVETINQYLLDNQTSYEYITFLKSILNHD